MLKYWIHLKRFHTPSTRKPYIIFNTTSIYIYSGKKHSILIFCCLCKEVMHFLTLARVECTSQFSNEVKTTQIQLGKWFLFCNTQCSYLYTYNATLTLVLSFNQQMARYSSEKFKKAISTLYIYSTNIAWRSLKVM